MWVRGYEDRIDLISVMIAGPARTPYEGGLFVFDVQLGGEYPRAPPLCHYHSYCSDRLNPNLYEDGKVIILTCSPDVDYIDVVTSNTLIDLNFLRDDILHKIYAHI